MVFPELPALILARIPLGRGRFGRDPRRAFLDGVADVRRPVELRIQVFGRRLGLWADADRPIAEQTSLGPLLVDESVVRGFGAQRATHRIDEDVVLVFLDAEHLGLVVLREPPLLIGAYPALENHPPVFDVDREVVDVDRAVVGETLAHEPRSSSSLRSSMSLRSSKSRAMVSSGRPSGRRDTRGRSTAPY